MSQIHNFDAIDRAIVRRLQGDLPLHPEPYRVIAEELGMSEEALLERLNFFVETGVIRRFGATVNHRDIGFSSNAMVVWAIEDEHIKEITQKMIGFVEVSHCYERPTFPDWPYNIYTMIHGKNEEECEKTIKEIADAVNSPQHVRLYSAQELKKTSMQYFND